MTTTREVRRTTVPHRPGLTFLILSVAVVAFGLVQALTIPVLAPIQRHYETSQPMATWVLTSYLLLVSTSSLAALGRARPAGVWGCVGRAGRAGDRRVCGAVLVEQVALATGVETRCPVQGLSDLSHCG